MKEDRKKSKIFEELEYCRAIAALSVLAIHVTSLPVSVMNSSSLLFKLFFSINKVLQYSVPLFLMLSAILEGHHYHKVVSTSKVGYDWKSFYQKKFFRIVLPYFGWSLLYLCFYTFIFRLYSLEQVIQLKSVFHFFILGKSSYHLYFIIILIQFYLVFPLLTLLDKVPQKYRMFLLIANYGLQFLLVKIMEVKVFPVFPEIVTTYVWYLFPLNSALILGFTYPKSISKNKIITLLLGAISLLFGGYYLFMSFQIHYGKTVDAFWYLPSWYLYTFCVSLVLLNICRFLSNKKAKWLDVLKRIGKYSYGIYFVHPIVIFGLEKVLSKIPNPSNLLYATMILFIYLITLIISMGISWIISRFSVTAWLLGQKKSRT